MSDATSALEALATALSAVAPVRTGRAALETTSVPLPVITLWSTEDVPATEQGYGTALQYTRTVLLELKVAASETYPVDLDTALTGIRRALRPDATHQFPLAGYAVALRQTGTRFFAPADNGAVAMLQLTLEIDYLERL